MESVAHVEKGKKDLVKDVYRVARLGVCPTNLDYGGAINHNGFESSLLIEVNEKLGKDPIFLQLKETILNNIVLVFCQGGYGVL